MRTLLRHEVRAVLGPTNSGKTHRAIQRMLGHRSGMIGLPLRLLAREVYDRVVAVRGRDHVALITGEEKIVPREPRYFVCTVEAMPMRCPVAFLAVDEVQLAQSADRGHTFTERVLGSRGQLETWFLGSETMAPVLERLVPGIVIEIRPRMSTLRHAPPKKLTTLPPRSAVVAFSMGDVYEIAERLKVQHGGAAVVLGALSPRTRNAQVAMYQAGEVAHLVATDAIGMGLNLDVDHVAFAGLQKFDGRELRPLEAHELGQIAGRAGRANRDGTFGVTAGQADMEPEVVRAVETHTFRDVRRVTWRNAALDFQSLEALAVALGRRPPRAFMDAVPAAYDTDALAVLSRDPDIRKRAVGHAAVELLWEVCRIPDYRKTLTDSHTSWLGQVYSHLMGPGGRLATDWVEAQLRELDRPKGDIETLMTRIAFVRTWTYVAFRSDWVHAPEELQARARGIEDCLSDALHDALTTRFVDRKGLTLVRPAPGTKRLEAGAGSLTFGEALVGTVHGLSVVPAPSDSAFAARAQGRLLHDAASSVVSGRVAQLAESPDQAFSLQADGLVHWEGAAVGRLKAGRTPATPTVAIARNAGLGPQAKTTVEARLQAFLRHWLDTWFQAIRIESDEPGVRGLVHALEQGLGSTSAFEFAAVTGALRACDRRALARAGIRLGQHVVYQAELLRPDAVSARVLLAAVSASDLPAQNPVEGAPPAVRIGDAPRERFALMGYSAVGPYALRHDVYETALAMVRRGRTGAVGVTLGALESEAPAVVRALAGRVPDRRRGRG